MLLFKTTIRALKKATKKTKIDKLMIILFIYKT
jgi:hypothetical protein